MENLPNDKPNYTKGPHTLTLTREETMGIEDEGTQIQLPKNSPGRTKTMLPEIDKTQELQSKVEYWKNHSKEKEIELKYIQDQLARKKKNYKNLKTKFDSLQNDFNNFDTYSINAENSRKSQQQINANKLSTIQGADNQDLPLATTINSSALEKTVKTLQSEFLDFTKKFNKTISKLLPDIDTQKKTKIVSNPKKIRDKIYILTFIILLNLSVLSQGYFLSIFAPCGNEYLEINYDNNDKDNQITILSNLNLILTCGAFFGSLIGGPISDSVGRKKFYLAIEVIRVANIFVYFIYNINLIYFNRFVDGTLIGMVAAFIGSYVNEISPDEYKLFGGIMAYLPLPGGM